MHISVIVTGGTIACKEEDRVLSPGKRAADALEKWCEEVWNEIGKGEAAFIVSSPYLILSEDLTGAYMVRLIREVNRVLKEEHPEGIVIFHGTDTLCYAAAVFVSSNHALDHPLSNGRINLRYAFEWLLENVGECGDHSSPVTVSYVNQSLQDPLEKPVIAGGILDAKCLYGYLAMSDILYGKHFSSGMKTEDKAEPDARDTAELNAKERPDTERIVNRFYVNPSWFDDAGFSEAKADGKVVWIKVCPGMVYPKDLDGIRYVLVEGYHSGTLHAGEEFAAFMRLAKAKGVPVFVCSLPAGEAVYETVDGYVSLGAVPVKGISPFTIYARLWLACLFSDRW